MPHSCRYKHTPTATVFVREGSVYANSRDVAAYFEKRHADVLRSITDLASKEPSLCQRNFALTSNPVQMPNGGSRIDTSYDMDRDGFTLLAMSFTGPKALKFTSCSCPWNS